MDDLMKNKLFLLVLVLGFALIGAIAMSDKFQDMVADRVIEKMMLDYSPSPYGPSFDPDKIDVEKIRDSSDWRENR